jgi:hypothetical protein
MLGDFHMTTRCYIPEDRTLHIQGCENLKPLPLSISRLASFASCSCFWAILHIYTIRVSVHMSSHSDRQEIPCLRWNETNRYRVQKTRQWTLCWAKLITATFSHQFQQFPPFYGLVSWIEYFVQVPWPAFVFLISSMRASSPPIPPSLVWSY